MNCLRLLRIIERQPFSLYKTLPARYVSNHPIRFMETENMWKEKDGVSQRWKLIYKAPMSTVLNFASTYLTLTSGIIGAGGIYYGAFVYDVVDLDKPVVIGEDVVIANNAIECFAYLGAFLALHVAVKMVLSKYVVRMYQDGDDYLAVYRGHLFNSISKHKFHLNDFKKLNPIVIIPWSESRYSLGKRQGIIIENYFKTPKYYNYLLYKQKKGDKEE